MFNPPGAPGAVGHLLHPSTVCMHPARAPLPPLADREGHGPAEWLSGPWPGVVAVTAGLLALAGLGFGIGALYASALPPAAALAAAADDPGPGIGGPDASLAVPAAGAGPDLAAAAVRSEVLARDLGAADLSRPVLRPVPGGWVSSGFGRRTDPFTGRPAAHLGIDFAGLRNSAIVASGAGIVTHSGPHRGYGNLVEIDHGGGYVSRYGHNASNLVAVGDRVKAGQVIALMGATGRATGNHLHFEILRDGRPVNPARLVAAR
jgi:murein DD-endopeptidase MepM/ murein hydrolase activator NlpD